MLIQCTLKGIAYNCKVLVGDSNVFSSGSKVYKSGSEVTEQTGTLGIASIPGGVV
jgi:hypothetical protein